MIRKRFLDWYAGFIFQHRVPVLLGTIVLTLLAGAACLRLQLHTSREALGDADTPATRAYRSFIEEFGTPNQLLVVVGPRDPAQPPDPSRYEAFVDALAARLNLEKAFFADVYYRLDLEAFESNALHFLPLEDLRGLVDAVTDPGSALGRLPEMGSLADANRLLAEQIRAGVARGEVTSADPAADLRRLLPALEWEGRFLEDPTAAVAELDPRRLAGSLAAGRGVNADGYLVSHDGLHYFLVARPSSATSDLDFINPMIRRVREQIADVEEEYPELRGGITGLPAMIQEEMEAVRRDTLFTTSLAVIGIALLSVFAFHRRRLAPLVLAALVMGVTWAGALIAITIGYLNLITSSFAAILVGLGIDFGVHIVSQYEIETAGGRDCQEAIGAAIRKVGPGLLASTFTTATAFFSITLLDFPGFAQLGFVGGWGIVLCLLATFTALPAMLAIEGARRGCSGRRDSRLSRGDRVSQAILRFPWATLALGLAVTVGLALEAGKVRFDDNIRNLLPPQAESLQLQETVLRDSELSPDFLMVIVRDPDELERLQARAAAMPHIARTESILTYLPADAAEREPLLQRLRRALSGPGPRHRGFDRRDLVAALAGLQDALAEVEEVAFAEGRTDLLAASGEVLGTVEGLTTRLRAATPPDEASWQDGEALLFRKADDIWRRAKDLTRAPPPTPEDLPQALRTRLISPNGAYLLYFYPFGNIAEPGAVQDFIRDARAVSPEVTGYPILVEDGTEEITSGFSRVILVGTLLTALALLIDFRQPLYALGAALCTAIGICWMLGLMGLSGIQFSLANLPTVPLVLGAGVAYGIHVLHRYREERAQGLATVLHHTGRAILISALTTMIGFGSMSFASHRGVSSLGKILLFGIGSCFVCATVLLPCALDLINRRRGPAS
ncbi:MAG: MMPL family transporter [Acidobacteriota bacterium]